MIKVGNLYRLMIDEIEPRWCLALEKKIESFSGDSKQKYSIWVFLVTVDSGETYMGQWTDTFVLEHFTLISQAKV